MAQTDRPAGDGAFLMPWLMSGRKTFRYRSLQAPKPAEKARTMVLKSCNDRS